MPDDGMSFYQRFEWLVVRYKDVRSGDLIANEATVTTSRRARKDDWPWERDPEHYKGKWFIRCGQSTSRLAEPETAIVIGRLRRA